MQNNTFDDLIGELDQLAIAIEKHPEQFLPEPKPKTPDAPKNAREVLIIRQGTVPVDQQSFFDVIDAVEED